MFDRVHDARMTAAAAPLAARSLRLAVVTETFPPEVNGVAGTVARLLQSLQQRGHHMELVRPRQRGSAAADIPGVAQVLTHGMPIPVYRDLTLGLPAGALLRQRWAAQRPDLVHVATEGPLGWSAVQAARALGIAISSDFRTNFDAYSRHYGFGWLQRPILAWLRRFHRATHCTMVPTEEMRARLADLGFGALRVLGRGVDTVLFTPQQRSAGLRRDWGAGADTAVVLHVGRLAPEKNLGLLAEAYERMCRVNRDLRLVIVGDGPARARLQARLPSAVFAGTRRGQDLAAHYASADVFLFPSLTETFGNVTAEAMASGLAVLAFDYAAAARLVRQGRNGVLARYGDPIDFSRRAMMLAADPTALRPLGRAARQTALTLDWSHVAERFEATAHELVRRGGQLAPDAPATASVTA